MGAVSKEVIVASLVALCLGMLVGGLIGHFATDEITSEEEEMVSDMKRLLADKWTEEEELNQRIIDMVNTNNLRANLMELTKAPHLAATDRDNQLAELLRDRFQEAGFDTAQLVPHNVLLSRPDPDNPNLVTLEDQSGTVFTSKYKEEALHPDDDHEDFVHAFNAFTPAGDVVTEKGSGLVYVNYARVEDFDKLELLNVTVKDMILIARYGKIFRGNKLLHAQERGAKGLILFSDPEDVALEGVTKEEVYPNTFWLPGSGMQRGTTYMGDGDPLTPGWASTEYAYRLTQEEADLPTIPCQPIGYDDARVILEKMDKGTVATPEEWKGDLQNIPYNLGPSFLPEYKNLTLRLKTNNKNDVRKSYNVIGTIRGDVEPDRYVIIGNHRDAWGFGASDPSSGTAQLLETARVLGVLLQEGWRPRRTLVFCSWGAEEYGLIGSYEWVEEHVDKLQERTVMYVNTDTCASGPILNAPASPMLWDSLTTITKLVPGVQDASRTVYDEWAEYHRIRSNATSPVMETLGSGSDHAPFSFLCGIPCMDVWFRRDQNKYDISIYPSYHTGYETFYMVDNNVDPGFKIHQGCSRIAALTLRYFADSAVIPYSLGQLPRAMMDTLDAMEESGQAAVLENIYSNYDKLVIAVDNFTVAVDDFTAKVDAEKDNFDPVVLRAVNDQMLKLEQTFIMPAGLPGRPGTRHAVFAPSQFDSYATAAFPGLSDLLYQYDSLTGEDKAERDKQIKRHISDLTIMTQRASSLLQDLYLI